jgi:hypothetical protein
LSDSKQRPAGAIKTWWRPWTTTLVRGGARGRFEVTTIRRDLALLNGQGRLARTYGGAMAMGAHPEASLRQRTGEAFEQKHAIARWAASVIVPGENILLDAGSTAGKGGWREDFSLPRQYSLDQRDGT